MGNGRNLDLHTALTDAEARFAAANPASRRAYERACAGLPGGNTRTVLFYPPFPTVLHRGEGCRVEDIDGHVYLDFQVEQTAGLYGHSDPTIRAAIEAALDRGLVLGGPIETEAELADLLTARFPAIERVRFTNSGTEANLLALCAARAATGRNKVMAFTGSYHGSVISFGPYGSSMNVPFPLLLGRYNDAEAAADTIAREADDLAAVIVEPMTGSGGCIPATREFLGALRDATSRHGVVLIFDEVMTSRLGPGGLHGELGLTPDLVTLGKYIGGGLTFGAFGGRSNLMDRFDPRRPDAFSHAGTFNNNILTLSAATAGLREVFTADAARRLNAAGERLRERLNGLIRERDIPAQVTGYGSMMMLHLTDAELTGPADSGKVDPKARALFHIEMLNRGVYVARRNMMVLSLPMTEADRDELVTGVTDFLDTHRPLLCSLKA